jgi:hypothetical protein
MNACFFLSVQASMRAYFATAVSYTCKKFTVLNPMANPIKHSGFVMNRFFDKLVCLAKQVKRNGNNKNTQAYFIICPLFLSMYVLRSLWVKIFGGIKWAKITLS